MTQTARVVSEKGNSRTGLPRVAAYLFLVVVAANAASLPFLGAGHWWLSSRFWLGRSAILITAGLAAWSLRERDYRRRAKVLEQAVSERTQALERERGHELERNRILEMLVAKQPMDAVLDAIARLMCSQAPGSLGVIVKKCGERCEILAAPGVSDEWRAALEEPYAVPFEAWRERAETGQPGDHPAWRVFVDALDVSLNSPAPAFIQTWPIGNPQAPLAALLVFGPGVSEPAIPGEACRMARIVLEHHRLQDDLQFQARHDSLTKLPNRAQYEERAERSLRDAKALGEKLAVLYVDLDHFKRVNDTFGHRIGDRLLAEVASRITGVMRTGDIVARIGGDEFTIVMNALEEPEQVSRLAGRLLDDIREPVLIDGHRIEISASVGFAIFPDDGGDLQQLERAADAAMYHAKDLGRDRTEAFATRNDTLDRVRMEEELRQGLRHGWFTVYYQAKVGADRRVVGFEALVRMNHPERGLVPPMSFIPVAEANGMIVPLGAWVLEEVCRQMAEWETRGLGQVPVAVNVSPVQIGRHGFAQTVRDCVTRHGICPRDLELELTEGLLINPGGVVQAQLMALRELGVQLSIDDFGTGYSSLSYLHRLQVDSIKLDRSFVQSIDTDDLARRLVQAMVGVAQGLGLSAVAEGVETEAQRTTLLAAGCRLMQGFLFARPQPASELEELLRASAWDHASLQPDPESKDLIQLSKSVKQAVERVDEAITV